MDTSVQKYPSEKEGAIVDDRRIYCDSIDTELRTLCGTMGATIGDPCIYCHSIDTELTAIFSMHELSLVCRACGRGFALEQLEDGEWVTRESSIRRQR